MSSSGSRSDHLFQLALLPLRAGFKRELFLFRKQIGWWIQKSPLTLIKRVPHPYLSQHQRPQLRHLTPKEAVIRTDDLPFGQAPSRLYLCLPPGLLISFYTPFPLRLRRGVLLRFNLGSPKFFTVSHALPRRPQKALPLTHKPEESPIIILCTPKFIHLSISTPVYPLSYLF